MLYYWCRGDYRWRCSSSAKTTVAKSGGTFCNGSCPCRISTNLQRAKLKSCSWSDLPWKSHQISGRQPWRGRWDRCYKRTIYKKDSWNIAKLRPVSISGCLGFDCCYFFVFCQPHYVYNPLKKNQPIPLQAFHQRRAKAENKKIKKL